MKKHFLNTANIKVYASASLVSFFFLTGFNQANATSTDYKPLEAKITYVGAQNSLLTFNIDYANVEETPFTFD